MCVIGAGFAGISIAYELVTRDFNVVLVEADEVCSGETGHTSGHLSYILHASYEDIAKKHGKEGAHAAADSHFWAVQRVHQLVEKLGIDCDFRKITGYKIPHCMGPGNEKKQDLENIRREVADLKVLQMPSDFLPNSHIKGWDGDIDQGGGSENREQATFHPTKYLDGILNHLGTYSNFRCYTNTRVLKVEEVGGLFTKKVKVSTEGGNTIECDDAIEATNMPLQTRLDHPPVERLRTYCIAVRIPKGSVEDCLILDSGNPRHYVRITPGDHMDDFLIVGGQDHAMAEAEAPHRYDELERWTRLRFPQASTVNYKWSGQVLNSIDHVGFIGRKWDCKHTWIVSGDTGNGLTNGLIASRIIVDGIAGFDNPWFELYDPSRFPLPSTPRSLPRADILSATQNDKFETCVIAQIDSLPRGEGWVVNKPGFVHMGPVAVYKDGEGTVWQYSGICPHFANCSHSAGRLEWNEDDKTFDCPVDGSRFSKAGRCVKGPSTKDLKPLSKNGREDFPGIQGEPALLPVAGERLDPRGLR